MLEVGDDAPEFELPNQHGETVRRSDFAGERLVVYFYPRANTAGCTTEACEFEATRAQFADRDVSIVGISDDPVDDLAAFAREHGLTFDLLADERGEVATLYDSYGDKQLFGNHFQGVFRNTYVVGPDETIEAVYENVTPADHAQTVFDDLTATEVAASD